MNMYRKAEEVLVFKTGTFDKKSGHETVHSLLAECLNIQGINYTDEEQLDINEHGKPSLKGYPDVYFNLSHAKEICACLVTSCECGVDCENVREYRPRVLKRSYSEIERQTVEALDGAERDLMFFRLWTLKEAYVKAISIGISYPMNEVEFQFEGNKLYSNIKDCTFEQYIINNRYVISICKLAASQDSFVKYIETRDEKYRIK